MCGEFVVSEDMYAVIGGKARTRLGMGLWATCHVSNLIIEGKVGRENGLCLCMTGLHLRPRKMEKNKRNKKNETNNVIRPTPNKK